MFFVKPSIIILNEAFNVFFKHSGGNLAWKEGCVVVPSEYQNPPTTTKTVFVLTFLYSQKHKGEKKFKQWEEKCRREWKNQRKGHFSALSMWWDQQEYEETPSLFVSVVPASLPAPPQPTALSRVATALMQWHSLLRQTHTHVHTRAHYCSPRVLLQSAAQHIWWQRDDRKVYL